MDKQTIRKTIAVQTFWNSQFNYGQLLQGYALQKFLCNHGYYSYIIRFESLLSYIKEVLILCVHFKLFSDLRQKKLRKFDEFRRKNIRYSNVRYWTFASLKRNPPVADYYIVGSDQVWAYMRNIERRKAYLLSFGQDKIIRIAYAASFGRDSLKDDKSFFQNAFSYFHFLGIRERTGVEICKAMGADASWVTDPVTLLSAQEWRNLKEEISIKKEGSLFFYTLTNSHQYRLLRSCLQSKYVINYTNSSELPDSDCRLFPSPNEWLSYIDDSEVVVTDSFHCTMFCIIFNKQFVTISRDGGECMSNRLTSMLDRLKLSERYVKCNLDDVCSVIEKEINWGDVNDRLNEWIFMSKKKLLESLDVK